MIDSFPYDSQGAWPDGTGELPPTFWTFGPTGGGDAGDLTGTFVLTALGMLLMVGVLVAWVVFEKRKLEAHAERLADKFN
jgi:hypothetical protein